MLLVANKQDRTVGIVDPQSGQQIAVIDEGGTTGHELATSSDGRLAFVPIYGDSGVGQAGTDGSDVVVMDIAARKVVASIDFGRGVRPHGAVFNPQDGLLYVTTELDNAVSVIDPRTLKVLGSIPTGQSQSHMLAITPDGRRGYTANVGPGTVSVLDLEYRITVAVIPVSSRVQRISLSRDGSLVFTSDQTKPRLAVIDTSTNRMKMWAPLPAPGYGTAPTPDGHFLVVAMPSTNQVAVVEMGTMKVVSTIDVPASPQEVVVCPDGRTAYVSCDASQQLAALRVWDWTIEKLIDVGAGADGLAWAAAE
jgi:YVTN family beta-propeller protein